MYITGRTLNSNLLARISHDLRNLSYDPGSNAYQAYNLMQMTKPFNISSLSVQVTQ